LELPPFLSSEFRRAAGHVEVRLEKQRKIAGLLKAVRPSIGLKENRHWVEFPARPSRRIATTKIDREGRNPAKGTQHFPPAFLNSDRLCFWIHYS
jgi:hypothetical protein